MKLKCGPTPNVMVALPNIGGALCSTLRFPIRRQPIRASVITRRPCFGEAVEEISVDVGLSVA